MKEKINTWLLVGIFLLQIIIAVGLFRNRTAEKTVVIDEAFMKAFAEGFATTLNKIQSVPEETAAPQTSEKDMQVRTIEILADRISIGGKTMSVPEFEQQASSLVGPTTKVLLQKSDDANYKTAVEALDILRKNGVVHLSMETTYRQPKK
ncbi:MAG: biopolymer transporter ExbD [Nibricoccus sp.]